jgi:hypothetical protein
MTISTKEKNGFVFDLVADAGPRIEKAKID